MSEILVIGEPEIVEGFALTGAQIRSETDPVRVAHLVDRLVQSQEADIIVITESLLERIPEKTRSKAEASGKPVFVSLPRPAGTDTWEGHEDLISRIIRRAIGYRLKVRR